MFDGEIMWGKMPYWACMFMSSTPMLLTILSVYLGLIPQLIGVAPEKAIKLTVSD